MMDMKRMKCCWNIKLKNRIGTKRNNDDYRQWLFLSSIPEFQICSKTPDQTQILEDKLLEEYSRKIKGWIGLRKKVQLLAQFPEPIHSNKDKWRGVENAKRR